MKKKKSSRQAHGASGTSGVISASVFGWCIGIFCAVVLLLISATVCLFSSDPDKLISPLAFISTVAVYLISGIAAVRKRRAPLPCGAICGIMLSATFGLISVFIDNEGSQGLSLPVSLLIRLSFVAVCILGALLGTNVGVKKSRRRK